ncbi:MAG: hypothetical protein AAB360_00370 [Patescibacteria group bacterium]
MGARKIQPEELVAVQCLTWVATILNTSHSRLERRRAAAALHNWLARDDGVSQQVVAAARLLGDEIQPLEHSLPTGVVACIRFPYALALLQALLWGTANRPKDVGFRTGLIQATGHEICLYLNRQRDITGIKEKAADLLRETFGVESHIVLRLNGKIARAMVRNKYHQVTVIYPKHRHKRKP